MEELRGRRNTVFDEGPQGDARFIAGVPEVIITDPAYNAPVWIDPMHPETWVDQLRRDLGPIWAHE